MRGCIAAAVGCFALSCSVLDPDYLGPGAGSGSETRADASGGGPTGDATVDGDDDDDDDDATADDDDDDDDDDDVTTGGAASCSDGRVMPGELCFADGGAYVDGVVSDISAADFNSDGDVDVVACGAGFVQVLAGSGDGSFAAPTTISAREANYVAVATGDWNGDDIADVVAARQGAVDRLQTIVSNGDGTFAAPIQRNLTGNGPFSLAVSGFDDDERRDVVTGRGGTPVALAFYRSNGDGTLADPLPSAVGEAPAAIAAGVLATDGETDVVLVSGEDAELTVAAGQGDGTFTESGTYAIPGRGTGVIIRELDASGQLDVAVTCLGDRVAVLLGNGDGSLAPEASEYAVGPEPQGLAAADLDGDAIVDLAVVTRADGRVWVLRGLGEGAFGEAEPLVGVGSLTDPTSIIALDLNGDPVPDLVVGGEHGVRVVLSDP